MNEKNKPEGPLRPPSAPPTPARPTPVRDLMAGSGDAPATGAAELRVLESEGETWHVRVGGRQRSGTSPDRGASLLLLFFQRSPDEGTPDREAYAPARSLDDVGDDELLELLARSRPHRPPEAPAAQGTTERRRRRDSRRRGGS